jgi:hypothetical protein
MSEGGFVFAMGACLCCGKTFSFNPHKVPSSSAVTGRREPICRGCFDAINTKRKAQGLPPFELQPDAYEPLPESEL